MKLGAASSQCLIKKGDDLRHLLSRLSVNHVTSFTSTKLECCGFPFARGVGCDVVSTLIDPL